MTNLEVRQENNTTGSGDIVAGDKTVIYEAHSSNSTLDELYKRYQREKERDQSLLSDFIDELKYFSNKIDRQIIGLDKKLSDADLNSIIGYALECKEKFQKLLYSHQYSQAAQEIYLLFLCKTQAIFNFEVKPDFHDLKSTEKMTLVRKKIADTIHRELGSNPLGIGFTEIFGMVFFLTGNCHLTWK